MHHLRLKDRVLAVCRGELVFVERGQILASDRLPCPNPESPNSEMAVDVDGKMVKVFEIDLWAKTEPVS